MTAQKATTTPVRLSAGVVVARRHGGEWRLLILRCYNHWDFPKGTLEPGETPLQAAIRETAEESSVTDLDFLWGEIHCETAPYRRGKVARYYLAQTQQADIYLPIAAGLGRPEHDEWRWVDFDEAAHLLPPRLQPILAWAQKKLTG